MSSTLTGAATSAPRSWGGPWGRWAWTPLRTPCSSWSTRWATSSALSFLRPGLSSVDKFSHPILLTWRTQRTPLDHPSDENHIFDDVTSLIKTFQPPALDQTKVFPAANFEMGDTTFPQPTHRAKTSFLFSFLTNLDMTSKPFSSTRLYKGSFYYTFHMKASSISLRQVLCCLTSQWWDWNYSLI